MQIKLIVLIPAVFLILGFTAQGENLEIIKSNDSISGSEFKLKKQAWKVGANYTFLPLPKLEEGTIKYGNLGISLDYEIRPKLWLGTGLGMAYWEYHKRTVTRTIDQIQIDPTTKAISYTYIDSVTGFTNKFNFGSIPAKVRLDLLNFKNQTVFLSAGASLHIAFRELEGFEDNHSSGKAIGPPDDFTFFSFGTLSIGYEYHQFKGWSSALSLDYRRTIISRGIPEQLNNYFGATVSVSFDFNSENWH